MNISFVSFYATFSNGEGLDAHMSVIFDKKSAEDAEKSSELKIETDAVVKSALEQAISSGRMGSLRVDPSYLLFESQLGK